MAEQVQQVKNDGKGLSIAGMVLGICSIVLVVYLGFILGVLATIFSAIGLKRKKNGFAVAGLVTGIIGTIISIIVGIVFVTIVSYGSISQRADDAQVQASATTVQKRAELTYATYGVYPNFDEMQIDVYNNYGITLTPQGEGSGGDVIYIPCYGEGAIIWYWSVADDEYKQIDLGSTSTCEWND